MTTQLSRDYLRANLRILVTGKKAREAILNLHPELIDPVHCLAQEYARQREQRKARTNTLHPCFYQ